MRTVCAMHPTSLSVQFGLRRLARTALAVNIAPLAAITNDDDETTANSSITLAITATASASTETTTNGEQTVVRCEQTFSRAMTATTTRTMCTSETQTNTVESANMSAVLGQLRVLALTRHVTPPETREIETQTPTTTFHECLHCDTQYASAEQLRSHAVGCGRTPLAVRLINGICPSCREPNTQVPELVLLKCGHLLCVLCMQAMRRVAQLKRESETAPGDRAPTDIPAIRYPVCMVPSKKSIFTI